MQIRMSVDRAEEIVSLEYPGASKPLTKKRSGQRPHSLDWWLDSPRTERAGTDRHLDGVRFLLQIAQNCIEPLPLSSFPALFVFDDGTERLPDKGQIKALMSAGWICARIEQEELIFQATERAEFG